MNAIRDNLNRILAVGNVVVYNRYSKEYGCCIWEGVYTVRDIFYRPHERTCTLVMRERFTVSDYELVFRLDEFDRWDCSFGNVIKVADNEDELK